MATQRRAARSTTSAPAASDALVHVRNEAPRAGVPLAPSFTHWVTTALRMAGRRERSEVNILIVGSQPGRDYNRQFRQRDYATNVLSFPYQPMAHEKTALIGDLVICAPVVAIEAIAQEKKVRDHYAHMTIHGVLHLLGFDHIDDSDAERMETIERRILATLGIGDPYRHDAPAAD